MNESKTIKISLESLGLTLSNAPPKSLSSRQEETMETVEPQSLQKSFVFVSDAGSDDSGSIVVLGKNSLDEIQRRSLASYEQIRQKSMTMDCKSIISSLTLPEIEEKLTNVLQENFRLREALEKSNSSMKEHLNILITRQEELARVHSLHKQKFVETKNLVKILKAENNEYRTKIEKQNGESTERSTQTEMREDETNLSEASNGKVGGEETTGSIETRELRDREIARMQIIINSLEQQLGSFYKNSFKSTKIDSDKEQRSEDTDAKEFLKNFTRYNEKLEALGNCYAAQISRYTSVQECLRRCCDITTESTIESTDESKRFDASMRNKELQEIRGKLIDEELRTICERQEMIKSQNEFQRIFNDYNGTLLEVESLRKEKEYLNSLQRGASLHDERLDEAKAALKRSEIMLDDERRFIEKSRRDLTKQSEELEKERIRLRTEEGKLIEAKVSLHEEAAAMRESNAVLREQLKVYESDWAEQIKICNAMRKEKNQLLDRVQKLETEKSELMTTMRCLEGNPID